MLCPVTAKQLKAIANAMEKDGLPDVVIYVDPFQVKFSCGNTTYTVAVGEKQFIEKQIVQTSDIEVK